jgi:hypothetical protein
MVTLNDTLIITDAMKNDSTKASELTRKQVELLNNVIHLVDSDEENKLDMFCYIKCSEEDNDIIKQCRGLVFNGDNIVLKAFPYTLEYNDTQNIEINNTINNINEWVFFESHEGALVRMFYFNGQWFLSTHRKLNAFKSKWASKESFGEIFIKALSSEENNNTNFKNLLTGTGPILNRFQNTLDTNKQYMFLILNNKDNRIVCSPPENPTVYHVGTFVNGELKLDENVGLTNPKKLSFDTVENLISYVNTVSYKELQGIIAFGADNKQVKIVNKDYQDLFFARGNEPSIKFRYLQIRMNRRFVNMLYYLYPDMYNTFDEYENIIYNIAKNIYTAYIQRFIKKRYVTVPKEEFAIIRDCHSWYMSNRDENRVSLEKIINVLNEQTPTNLNHMIRRFKMEKTHQTEQLSENRPRESVKSSKTFEQSPEISSLSITNTGMTTLRLTDMQKNKLEFIKNSRNLTKAVYEYEKENKLMFGTITPDFFINKAIDNYIQNNNRALGSVSRQEVEKSTLGLIGWANFK